MLILKVEKKLKMPTHSIIWKFPLSELSFKMCVFLIVERRKGNYFWSFGRKKEILSRALNVIFWSNITFFVVKSMTLIQILNIQRLDKPYQNTWKQHLLRHHAGHARHSGHTTRTSPAHTEIELLLLLMII